MTDDRSIERAARTWLETGPTEAPERAVEAALLLIDTTPQERDWQVPWRLPHMSSPVRALLGIAAVAVFLVGGVMLLRPAPFEGPGTGSSTSPSPSPAPSASPRFSLTGTFTSPRMGYSIGMADGWTSVAGTEGWTGTTTNEPPAADVVTVTGTDSTITIASQPMPADTTFEAWLTQFHQDSFEPITDFPNTPISSPSPTYPACNTQEGLSGIFDSAIAADARNFPLVFRHR